MSNTSLPTFESVETAKERIAGWAHHTPVFTNSQADIKTGASLFFKCENFQKVGAFKFRGASNAVFSLSDEEARKGVATHSSGNHAQALALAAKLRGIPAYVVMPENAPRVKVQAVKGYGAEITFSASTLQARESTLKQVAEQTGATFIHPYDDARIIAGQGTVALELLEDHPDLDLILAPVGGGGLLSGTALAAKNINPKIKVIGAEPARADDAYRSFKEGRLIPVQNPDTIADGLRTSLGRLPFALIQDHVDDMITVPEDAIANAMRFVWERMNIIIEASSAVPLAAIFSGEIDIKDQKVGIILSGGNVDLEHLPWG